MVPYKMHIFVNIGNPIFFQIVHKTTTTDICLVTNVSLPSSTNCDCGYNPILTLDMHVIQYSQDGRNRVGGEGG